MTGDMYNIDDLIQLSSLQHYAFCPRQCALIHVEQVWSENRLTAEGRIMHEHAHMKKAMNHAAMCTLNVARHCVLCGWGSNT